jgi:predicted porin
LEIFMQRQFLVAALLASVPFVASASDVTIYGIVDAAIAAEDTGAPDGSRTVINSGNQSGSRFGLRGSEDLGTGLKAIFNLEGGFKVDTGAGDTDLFGRRAVVGLQGSFGTVTLGREYSPVAMIAGFSDINGQGFFGSNVGAFNNGYLIRRLNNSINYKSNPASGLVAMAAYSTGEKTTGPSGDVMGLGLQLTAGALVIGGAYHNIERSAGGDDKEAAIGATLVLGKVKVATNYLAADPDGANNKFEQLNLGASMGFGPGTVFGNLQQNRLQGGAKGNSFSIAYSYALSKRTDLYTTYAQMRNNDLAVFRLNSSSTSVAPPASAFGADPRVFNVGVRHKF